MKGLYIVFEGIVGTGKSTQAKRLYEYLKEKYPNIILTREPGGSEIAEVIRKVVQGNKYSEEMEPICEAYLYAAARAQSLRKIVKPIINKGGIVIADRSYLSSVAYQGAGRNQGINTILEINKIAIEDIVPDIVIYLELDPKIGLQRCFDKEGDKFENEDIEFFKRAQQGYDEIAKEYPNWIKINAQGSKEEVFKKTKDKITAFLP
jgi:dTMP kinase